MRESDRKLAEYAEWLRNSTDLRPQKRWTPISISFAEEEGWCLTPMGIDESIRDANERANRERGL